MVLSYGSAIMGFVEIERAAGMLGSVTVILCGGGGALLIMLPVKKSSLVGMVNLSATLKDTLSILGKAFRLFNQTDLCKENMAQNGDQNIPLPSV